MATSSSDQTIWIEAGPLPVKIGEIGYVERTEAETRTESESGIFEHPHHPSLSSTNIHLTPPAPPSVEQLPSSRRSQITAPTYKVNRKPLWNKRIFAGFRLGTFIVFVLHAVLLLLIAAGWAIAGVFLSKSNSPLTNATLFFHVAFSLFTIIQLVFLERRIYGLRVERYTFMHPGVMLPSNRRNRPPNLAFGPWNRPPLPTYATAVAQSGVGTGDVEDHFIAAPAPPAYGNTRGSRLLLSGFLRNSLIAQRPLSQYSVQSRDQEPAGRPLSYITQHESPQENQDAERERRLEETLARLSPSEIRS